MKLDGNERAAVIEKLHQPFHPARVTWRPMCLYGDGTTTMPEITKAEAAPFVALKDYVDRLTEVAGENWAVSYTPWGDSIICHLTICGITRSAVETSPDGNTDEPYDPDLPRQIADKAFKRACGMFGLGRYLEGLPQMVVDYDTTKARFTDTTRNRLTGIIQQHYDRWKESKA